MECTLQVGDKVTPTDYLKGDGEPCAGKVYTIRRIGPYKFNDGDFIAVWLVECRRGGQKDYPYGAVCFRPVRTVDTTPTVAALAQAMREAMKKGRIDA